jgi:hypothetical protein
MAAPLCPSFLVAFASLMRLAFAAGLAATAATASGQEEAGMAQVNPVAGTCVATVNLGSLSLAPPDDPASPMPEAAWSDIDEAAGSISAENLPAYDSTAGFISLAGDAQVLVASCAAAGAPPSELHVAKPAEVAAAVEPENPSAHERTPAPTLETSLAGVATAEPRTALKTWWPAAEAGKLNLRFAGEAAFGEAIALLFDAPFSDPASLAQHVEVKNRAGKTVEGKWQIVTSNPQMVALRVPPGLYEIRIGDSLAAANGLRFQRMAEGKIFVR